MRSDEIDVEALGQYLQSGATLTQKQRSRAEAVLRIGLIPGVFRAIATEHGVSTSAVNDSIRTVVNRMHRANRKVADATD